MKKENPLSKMISRYFSEYSPKTYEEEIRLFFMQLATSIENINIYEVSEIKYDLIKYSIYFEIGLLSKRIQTLNNFKFKNVELINSYQESINILEGIMKAVISLQNENMKIKDVRFENFQLQNNIEELKTEIVELKKTVDVFGISKLKKEIEDLKEDKKQLQEKIDELIKLI